MQAFFDIHDSHVDLLLGNGEGLRGDVPDDTGFLPVRSVGEHRESVRAGDTSLLHNRYVGDVQHSAATLGFLEVSYCRHISERVPAMEGTDAEFGRDVATGARSAKSLPKGNR